METKSIWGRENMLSKYQNFNSSNVIVETSEEKISTIIVKADWK